MEQILEFVYWALCLTGAAMAYTSFHYFMKRRITDSLAVRHHSELMMALCFFMAVSIAMLVAIPYLFKIINYK